MRLHFIFFFLFFSFSFPAFSSTSDSSVVIRNIYILGNKHTKPQIILRELDFMEGERVPAAALPGMLVKSRENIFNTSLFNVVSAEQVSLTEKGDSTDILITVVERWYIWPIPYLEFPNHNVNAWLETTDFSLLTWGLDLTVRNMRGRNETLILLAHFGFNQKYGFAYKTPFINKAKTWGFSFGADFSLNRQLQVSLHDNKEVYMDTTDGYLQKVYSGYMEFFFRPSLYTYNDFVLSFSEYQFADTLTRVPGFTTYPYTLQGFLTFWYKFKLDRRDVQYYPLEGYYLAAEFLKQGFSEEPVNIFAIKSNIRKYWQLSPRWYWASGFTGRISFPQEQPFYLEQGLGYGRDFVRGYEYYVINGQHFVLLKNNLKFAIIPQRIADISFIRTTKFSIVPYALYLNLFVDAGYVFNANESENLVNPLNNTLLAGFGTGVDFVTYYDVIIGLDLSINALWKPGVYVHFIAPI